MRTKQNWPLVIEEFDKSGLSKVSFCKDRGISYQSFMMHFKRSQEDHSTGFRQIAFGGNVKIDERIDFYFPDGRQISFPISVPKEIIRFLVS